LFFSDLECVIGGGKECGRGIIASIPAGSNEAGPTGRDPGTGGAAVRDELDRLLASPLFIHSRRLTYFLRFVVAQTLAGDFEKIKERTLGTKILATTPTTIRRPIRSFVSLQRKSGNASRSIIRIRRITTNCTLRCRSDRRSRSLTGRQPKRRAPARSRALRQVEPSRRSVFAFPEELDTWTRTRIQGPGASLLDSLSREIVALRGNLGIEQPMQHLVLLLDLAFKQYGNYALVNIAPEALTHSLLPYWRQSTRIAVTEDLRPTQPAPLRLP